MALAAWDATPMEFVPREGRFWLPRQPKRVVHGTVIFGEDGVTLNKMMFDARRKLRAALAANGYLDDDDSGRS